MTKPLPAFFPPYCCVGCRSTNDGQMQKDEEHWEEQWATLEFSAGGNRRSVGHSLTQSVSGPPFLHEEFLVAHAAVPPSPSQLLG